VGLGIGRRSEAPQDFTDFAHMILENLKAAGVQQAHKEYRITFTSLKGWPGDHISAEGTFMEGDVQRRAGIFIGPEFGTVSRPDLVAAAREAGDAGFALAEWRGLCAGKGTASLSQLRMVRSCRPAPCQGIAFTVPFGPWEQSRSSGGMLGLGCPRGHSQGPTPTGRTRHCRLRHGVRQDFGVRSQG
jgi:hypothetical protein